MQRVYLLCGLPGSGKSTWAAKQIKSGDNKVIICKDKIREMLHGCYLFTPEVEPLVKDLARSAVYNALRRGMDIIIDETNITRGARKSYLDMIDEYSRYTGNEVQTNIIFFTEDTNNLINRMKDSKGTPKEEWEMVICKMMASFEIPIEDEINGEIVKMEIL